MEVSEKLRSWIISNPNCRARTSGIPALIEACAFAFSSDGTPISIRYPGEASFGSRRVKRRRFRTLRSFAAPVCYKRGAQVRAPAMASRPDPASPADPPSERAAFAVRWASGVAHYENFPVGSILFPRALRPAVLAIYRFARYADDVADEGEACDDDRLAELDRLRTALEGGAEHPEVERLRPHLLAHRLPPSEFLALLSAFSQDVRTQRYGSFAALRDYCARSADPIGHLVLTLFGSLNARTEELSDEICSALQLINFLQDLAIDWPRGRLYLALDELEAAGLGETAIRLAVESGRAPVALREFIATQSRRCGSMLERGAPLVAQVPTRLGWELRAILAGARRVLERLASNGYDPIARRPKLGWRDAPSLLRLMLADPAAR